MADPYSALFAPGGIVSGMQGVGNAVGDAFRSYAAIKEQRDKAALARAEFEEQQRQNAAANAYRQQEFGLRTQDMELRRQEMAARNAEMTSIAGYRTQEMKNLRLSMAARNPDAYLNDPDQEVQSVARDAHAQRTIELAGKGVPPSESEMYSGAAPTYADYLQTYKPGVAPPAAAPEPDEASKAFDAGYTPPVYPSRPQGAAAPEPAPQRPLTPAGMVFQQAAQRQKAQSDLLASTAEARAETAQARMVAANSQAELNKVKGAYSQNMLDLANRRASTFEQEVARRSTVAQAAEATKIYKQKVSQAAVAGQDLTPQLLDQIEAAAEAEAAAKFAPSRPAGQPAPAQAYSTKSAWGGLVIPQSKGPILGRPVAPPASGQTDDISQFVR